MERDSQPAWYDGAVGIIVYSANSGWLKLLVPWSCMFVPSILILCCIWTMLWLTASPLERGTPVPAKLVVLHLAGATDAGYFINFVSGAPAPHGTPDQKNFEAPSNLSPSQQAALGCGQCSGGGSSSASGLRDAPAVRSREKAGRPPGSPRHQEAGWKGQRTGAVPAKGPTDNPALEPRERLEQATAPEGTWTTGARRRTGSRARS